MSTDREPPTRNFVCGLFAADMGLLLLLTGMGIIPMKARAGDAPLWIAAVAGLAFMFAGTSIVFGAFHGVSATGELPQDAGWWSRLLYALGLVCCASLAMIGTWVSFGPGMRHFSGTGMFFLSPEGNNLVGRLVFGIGAVLTWIVVIAMGISGARKLFPRKEA
jgi:hypothetical protein